MGDARAILIGLNAVNPMYYNGWSGQLRGCENDVVSIEKIVKANGFKSVSRYLTSSAMIRPVLSEIKRLIAESQDNDLLLIYYSGHGGQTKDLNRDEADLMDETWCLYDGQLLDDTIYATLSTCKKKVNFVVMSDSCHSGTVMKASFVEDCKKDDCVYKFAPSSACMDIDDFEGQRQNKGFKSEMSDINALMIAACQDNQLSQDGAKNGLFTGTLASVINERPSASYEEAIRLVVRRMPVSQTPMLTIYGDAKELSKREFLRP